MIKKYAFWVALSLYVGIQIYTLPLSPLPWFDEVFFADISYSLYRKGNLIPEVAVFESVKLYGFVHFAIAALNFYLFGFSLLSYRIINYLAAAGVALLWLKLLKNTTKRQNNPNNQVSNWWILALSADPFFNLSMHEGRMDLTALCFAWLSLYYLSIKPLALLPLRYWFMSGAAVALALLTTPRIGFMLPLAGMLWCSYFCLSMRQAWKPLLLWVSTIFALYSIWILFAFGSYLAFVQYYLSSPAWHNNTAFYSTYIGNSGYIPKQSFFLILLSIFVVSLQSVKYTKKIQKYTWLDVFLALSIPIFYLLVYDFGPYSIFIIPCYYWLIARCEFHLKVSNLTIPTTLIIILGFNTLYFSLKTLQIIGAINQRSPQVAESFVRKHIPAKSRVVSEPMYYYALKSIGAEMQFMNYFETLQRREARHRKVFDYQYIIITEHLLWRDRHTIEYYQKNARWQEVARLHIPPNQLTQWLNRQGWLSTTERAGYNAIIYQRLR